jgi:alpha-galactosidase
MDAGWYPNNGSWWSTGTWEVDKTRFPNGLKPISDHAHKKGVDIIVWFEPERILKGTWLFEKHPEWTLGNGDLRLLNMGNPEAVNWVTDHISSVIKNEGIDFYRQDYNIDPLGYWQAADASDRQGITENHYVQGYLAYWDGLLARKPGMPIDTCASGGRRMDLETLRRSVPLLRSDYIFEPIGQQCHTYGLSLWVPYQGSGAISTNDYEFRSVMLSSMNCCLDVRRDDLDYANARKLFAELRSIAPCFMGDYYPLMPYTRSDDQWIAWQFDLKSEKRGVVQVFRRAVSTYESVRLKLRGLDASANYEVSGNGPVTTLKGSVLMKTGLVVTLKKQPEAAVIQYHEK